MNTYYKVVSPSPGGLLSAIVHHTKHFSKRYIPGVWTKAKVGGLLVFSSLRKAKKFASQEGTNLQVWTCATKYPVALPKFRLWNTNNFIPEFLAKTWKNKLSEGILLNELRRWPTYSVSFKQVKLIDRVV